MPGIFFQLKAFFLTMILGLGSAVILHFYQLLIRNAGVAKFLLYILDLIFWILMVMVIFMGMLYINQGEMRSYVLIALLIGGVVYYQALSRRCEGLLIKLVQGSMAVIKLLLKVFYCFPRDIIYRVKKMVIIHKKNNDDHEEE